MLQNQLLIVNPHDRIAVDVIARDVASNQDEGSRELRLHRRTNAM
jgi:hypothetical protein